MYTRALEVLDQLSISEPSPRVHQYRALCFIALGRPDAAERAMADIVAADPFFALEAEAASPRIAAQFAAVRRRLLPPLIRRGFADATAQYREGATARARQRFDDVLRLLDDPALQADQSLADLALVAGAFVELTKAQTPPPPIAVNLAPHRGRAGAARDCSACRSRAGAAGRFVIRRGRLCPRPHAGDGQRAGGVRACRRDGAAAAQVDAARPAGRGASVFRRDRPGSGCARPRGRRGQQEDDSSRLRPGRARGRPPVGVPAGAPERPPDQVGDHGRDRAAAVGAVAGVRWPEPSRLYAGLATPHAIRLCGSIASQATAPIT